MTVTTEQAAQLNKQARRLLPAHLLVLLNRLLLGLGDDAFQFVEASLHLCKAEPGVLLFPTDALQLLLTVLLSDAWTLLPLLYALREDLIDPAVDENSRRLMHLKAKKRTTCSGFPFDPDLES